MFSTILSVLISANSKANTIISNDTTKEISKSLNIFKIDMDGDESHVHLPVYSLYLIGFTMLLMMIAIIVLAVALYLNIKKKSIFALNVKDKQYIRQESTGVTPLYNYDEQNKNNGSTLTVNSGIIEISEPRLSDPVTPPRLEDSKIVFAKRPLKTMVPVMQRGQMDAICKEVLRKVKKSDSASFRDLNELLKRKSEEKFETKYEEVTESPKEKKNEEKSELVIELNKSLEIETKTQEEIKVDIKNETEEKIKNETAIEDEIKLNTDPSKDIKIEVENTECDNNADDSNSETEYDTVPSPIRYRHSGPEPDIDDIPFYDLPPRRSHDGPPRNVLQPLYDLPPRRSHDEPPKNVLQMDQDNLYLMPLSAKTTDSCYINAKRNSFHYFSEQ